MTHGGLACVACGGTGDYRAFRDLRAYRLGLTDGVQALRDGMPAYPGERGLDALQRALDGEERE